MHTRWAFPRPRHPAPPEGLARLSVHGLADSDQLLARRRLHVQLAQLLEGDRLERVGGPLRALDGEVAACLACEAQTAIEKQGARGSAKGPLRTYVCKCVGTHACGCPPSRPQRECHPPSSPAPSHLPEPVDRAAVDERRIGPQPLAERRAGGAERQKHVQVGAGLGDKEAPQLQGGF
jgi:hypothetical protein